MDESPGNAIRQAKREIHNILHVKRGLLSNNLKHEGMTSIKDDEHTFKRCIMTSYL